MLRLVTLALVMAMLPMGGAALGAEPNADRDRAEKLVDQGLTFARSGRFQRAVDKFEQANRLFPHPEIQHNLARAHEELGELKQAHRWYSMALKQEYTYEADGRTRLKKIDAELRKTYARLTVRTTPSEVEVRLVFADGQEERFISTPFSTWAPAGLTKATGTNPDFKTGTRELELAAGDNETLNLVLRPLPKQGFLSVQASVPGATVFLSEVLVGTLPMESIAHPAGVYDLKVMAESYKTYKQQVVIRQDELTSVTVALELADGVIAPPKKGDDGSGGGVPGWIGATLVGVGAAAVVAGVVLHAEAFRINDEANDVPISDPPSAEDEAEYTRLFNRAKDHQTYALITYIGAGVLVGTGVILLALSDDDEPAEDDAAITGITVVPQLGLTPDYVGAGALLRF